MAEAVDRSKVRLEAMRQRCLHERQPSRRPFVSPCALSGCITLSVQVTPTLVRTFVWAGRAEDCPRRFDRAPASLPDGELHVHAWADTTLRELVETVKEVCAAARPPSVGLHLSLVYPGKSRSFKVRPIGILNASSAGSRH